MARIAVYIDGFNVYHALDSNCAWHKYKWLDYRALAACYLGGKDTLSHVRLFTSLATWNPDKVQRHRILLRAQELRGVEIILGKFKRKDTRCRADCKKAFHTFEEKLTDVNMAAWLFRGAYLDEYDTAILITGDTDIIPAIKMIRSLFLNKKIGVVIPIGRSSNELKQNCDLYFRMNERQLLRSQLPDVLDGGAAGLLKRPSTWT
ncbi:MAG: NYN domain-containing protein [Candidatus Sumerlaeia bacterium]|nr:NYN domain-containing protein [Candidatus Sumerlaeia bacterium]